MCPGRGIQDWIKYETAPDGNGRGQENGHWQETRWVGKCSAILPQMQAVVLEQPRSVLSAKGVCEVKIKLFATWCGQRSPRTTIIDSDDFSDGAGDFDEDAVQEYASDWARDKSEVEGWWERVEEGEDE